LHPDGSSGGVFVDQKTGRGEGRTNITKRNKKAQRPSPTVDNDQKEQKLKNQNKNQGKKEGGEVTRKSKSQDEKKKAGGRGLPPITPSRDPKRTAEDGKATSGLLKDGVQREKTKNGKGEDN